MKAVRCWLKFKIADLVKFTGRDGYKRASKIKPFRRSTLNRLKVIRRCCQPSDLTIWMNNQNRNVWLSISIQTLGVARVFYKSVMAYRHHPVGTGWAKLSQNKGSCFWVTGVACKLQVAIPSCRQNWACRTIKFNKIHMGLKGWKL